MNMNYKTPWANIIIQRIAIEFSNILRIYWFLAELGRCLCQEAKGQYSNMLSYARRSFNLYSINI